MTQRPLTIGTAGHIDHGKTALVRALTGKETDRLPEERRRGISIELGYAQLDLGERRLSIVDVPGHERFVRNMIAGATGVDIFLMVIDAREGVMPQTREHLLILRSLGITSGVFALTKCDLAEPDRIGQVKAEAADLMPEIPIIATSATTGAGVDELKLALSEVGGRLDRLWANEPTPDRAAVMHIDRVFSVKGHGTIVTGTSSSDCFRQGDTALLLPSEQKVRLRSIQVHDSEVDVAEPNQRVALNLAGIDHDEVQRGDLISNKADEVTATFRFDASLWPTSVAQSLNGERVHVHHGTRETPARLINLENEGLAQIRLEKPLLTRPGDRFVLRRVSTHETVGGGEIIDDSARRHGPGSATAWLRALREGPARDILDAALADDIPVTREVEAWPKHSRMRAAYFRCPDTEWRLAIGHLTEASEARRESVPTPARVADSAQGQAEDSRRASPIDLDPKATAALNLITTYGLHPKPLKDVSQTLDLSIDETADLLDTLAHEGKLVKIEAGIYFSREPLSQAQTQIVKLAGHQGSVSIAEARDELGTGRRHAQRILEYCDRQKVTFRRGDRRYLRRPNQR